MEKSGRRGARSQGPGSDGSVMSSRRRASAEMARPTGGNRLDMDGVELSLEDRGSGNAKATFRFPFDFVEGSSTSESGNAKVTFCFPFDFDKGSSASESSASAADDHVSDIEGPASQAEEPVSEDARPENAVGGPAAADDGPATAVLLPAHGGIVSTGR
jgi:hypothetical protein